MSDSRVSDVQYAGLAVANLEAERSFFPEIWNLRERWRAFTPDLRRHATLKDRTVGRL